MRDRTVCSLRGFFQLALEIRESGKVTDLIANLPPLFWQNLKSILRQSLGSYFKTIVKPRATHSILVYLKLSKK